MDRTDERVLASFPPDGTLHTVPAKRAELLVVLDCLAQPFERGRHYPEAEEAGACWRSGGSVDG